MVRLEFTYTPEDLAEAAKFAAKTPLPGKTRRNNRSIMGWLLFIGLAVMLFMLFSQRKTPRVVAPPGPATRGSGTFETILLPLLPWLVIFGLIWFFVFRQLRGRYRKAWEESPDLQQQQTFDADPDGVRLATALTSTSMRWANFVDVGETTNLILIRTAGLGGSVVVPKRAASDPAQLAALRALLATHVSARTNAFPVLPAAPATQHSD